MLTPLQIAQLNSKYDSTRNWFGWSDWDLNKYQLQGALMAKANWQPVRIDAGILTIARESRLSYFSVDTEAETMSDALQTITSTGFEDGDQIFLRQANAGRLITIEHATGNLFNSSLANFTLDATNADGSSYFILSSYMLVNSIWIEQTRSPMPSAGTGPIKSLQLGTVAATIASASLTAEHSRIDAYYRDLGTAVAASGRIDVTAAGGDDGVIDVRVQYPSGAGEFSIGVYTQLSTDGEYEIESGIADAINALTATTGWSALYVPASNWTEVYAPVELGATPNTWVLALGNGTNTVATVTGMSGGIDAAEASTDLHTIVGMNPNSVSILRNANTVGCIRFVSGGNITTQGGNVLQPNQLATLIEINGGGVIAQIHESEGEIMSVASADLLQIGTAPFEVLPTVSADECWDWTIVIRSIYGTTTYALAADVWLVDDAGVEVATIPISTLTSTSNIIFKVGMATNGMPASSGLHLTTSDSSDPTTGDGTWELLITKTLHKF